MLCHFLVEDQTKPQIFSCYAKDAIVVNQIAAIVKYIIKKSELTAVMEKQLQADRILHLSKLHQPQVNALEPRKKVPDAET